MDYLETKELSEMWKITPRRVQMYCKEGCINGAMLKGSIWLIPKDAKNRMIRESTIQIISRYGG